MEEVGQKNTVLTLYELTQGDMTRGTGTRISLYIFYPLISTRLPTPSPVTAPQNYFLTPSSFLSLPLPNQPLHFPFYTPPQTVPPSASLIQYTQTSLPNLPNADESIIENKEFHGLDQVLLQRALAVSVKRGKAQVFGSEDRMGVKFF